MWRLTGSVLFVWLTTVTGVSLGTSSAGLAAEKDFPYEQDLLLDARPMKGSKRIPMMEVMRRGESKIDLWCNNLRAQFVIVEDTVTIIAGTKSAEPCPSDRARADDDLLGVLIGVTHWQRNGDVLVLRGPKNLRFRASTH